MKKSVKLRFVPATTGQRVRAGDLLDRTGQLDVDRPDQIRWQPDRGGVNPPYPGYRSDDLVIVGRTVPLSPAQSAELGAVLTPAKPGHPWPDEITSQRWGGKDSKKPLTKVEPLVVAEVAADAATQADQVRHSMRFIRLRPDLTPDDLDQLDS